MLKLAAVVILAVLAGCSRSDAEEPKADKNAARAHRARDAALQSPGSVTHHLAGGDLIVLEVPTVAPGGFADSQRCFVWRDAEFRTASLSCPADTSADVPDPH